MNSKSICRAWMFGPALSLSVALASCSGPVPMGTNTNGGSGNGDGTGNGGSGTSTGIIKNPGATSTSVSTGTEVTEKDACAVQEAVASKQASDLLLVLDRSGSMNWAMDSDTECTTFGGGGGGQAWGRRRHQHLSGALGHHEDGFGPDPHHLGG